MTSIIPFFILLLTTFALSAPVGPEYESSTSKYDYTTGQTNINTPLMSNYGSTGSPIVQKPRSVEDLDKDEITMDSVAHSSRVFPPPSYPNPIETYEKRSGDYSLDSKETGSGEKRESKESLNPSSSETYKKRTADKVEDSKESENSEKRESKESLIPSSTTTYKKRDFKQSEDSKESESSEKRESKESLNPSSSETYKKRDIKQSEDSKESESSEKRESKESLIPSSTGTYKKRSNEESQDSQEDQINDKRGLKHDKDSQEVEYKDKRNYDDSEEAKSDEKRSSEESNDSNEKRESKESLIVSSTGTYKKRSNDEADDSKELESNEKRDFKDSLIPSSTQPYKKRTAEDYVFTALESSAEFNQRAIRPVESQEEFQSSPMYSQKQMEMNSNVKPSSSVDSFGKFTGLLNNGQPGRFVEQPTPQSPIQVKKFSKTVSVVPGIGKKVETKSSVFMQPVQQEQLSQVQSQSVS